MGARPESSRTVLLYGARRNARRDDCSGTFSGWWYGTRAQDCMAGCRVTFVATLSDKVLVGSWKTASISRVPKRRIPTNSESSAAHRRHSQDHRCTPDSLLGIRTDGDQGARIFGNWCDTHLPTRRARSATELSFPLFYPANRAHPRCSHLLHRAYREAGFSRLQPALGTFPRKPGACVECDGRNILRG
jgi:hypothetical protein